MRSILSIRQPNGAGAAGKARLKADHPAGAFDPVREQAGIAEVRAALATLDAKVATVLEQAPIDEPPMDLSGAFLLHTAPNVRKVSEDAEGRVAIDQTQARLGREYIDKALDAFAKL